MRTLSLRSIRDVLANPYVSRPLGAIGAGAAEYLMSHDWRKALVTAVTFAAYGAGHSAATKAANAAPPSNAP
jgi:hypothetical protein